MLDCSQNHSTQTEAESHNTTAEWSPPPAAAPLPRGKAHPQHSLLFSDLILPAQASPRSHLVSSSVPWS